MTLSVVNVTVLAVVEVEGWIAAGDDGPLPHAVARMTTGMTATRAPLFDRLTLQSLSWHVSYHWS